MHVGRGAPGLHIGAGLRILLSLKYVIILMIRLIGTFYIVKDTSLLFNLLSYSIEY